MPTATLCICTRCERLSSNIDIWPDEHESRQLTHTTANRKQLQQLVFYAFSPAPVWYWWMLWIQGIYVYWPQRCSHSRLKVLICKRQIKKCIEKRWVGGREHREAKWRGLLSESPCMRGIECPGEGCLVQLALQRGGWLWREREREKTDWWKRRSSYRRALTDCH